MEYAEAKLVRVKHELDDIGQTIDTETTRIVPVEVKSIGFSEFYQAGQKGSTPSIMLVTAICSYHGESSAYYKGKYDDTENRYAIYRTYERPDGKIELYLRLEAGV